MNSTRVEILKKYGYNIPTNDLFKDKINDIFKVDIDQYSEAHQIFTGQLLEKDDDYKILIPKYGYLDESNWQPKIYINQNYIYWLDEEEDDLSFYHLNKYLIYNDNDSFQYLKSKNMYLFELISEFGYTKDEKIVHYGLDLIGDELNKINFESSLSLFIGSDGVFGKKQLRKNLIEEYLRNYPNTEYSFFILTEYIIDKDFDNYMTVYDGDRFSDSGFLLEKEILQSLKKDQWVNGGLDYIFEKNKEFLNWSKTQTLYPKLKEYAIDIYLPVSERETANDLESEKESKTTIQDPDGYTNLRQSANNQSKIIQQIKSGEEVDILGKQDNWYYIQTQNGNKGYVHKSRVQTQ